jgi:hypothetical protein
MERIRNKLGWGVSGALALLLLAAMAGVVQGGPLDPPGPPGSTGKNLITSLPFTISQPGSYVLNGNLTGVSGTDGITVQADNVTIDLSGFTLSGAPGAYSGISEGPFAPPRYFWTVRNGTIANWPNSGIFAQHVQNGTFEDLTIAGNGTNGSEALVGGRAITVRSVKATGNHGDGIVLGPVAQVSDSFVELLDLNLTAIVTGDQSAIRNCSLMGVPENSGGIITGSATTVAQNTVQGAWSAIMADGSSQIDANHIIGARYGVFLNGINNTVTRNSMRNVETPIQPLVFGDQDFAPQGPASSLTSPWGNVIN